MKLTFDQQKVLERARALEKRAALFFGAIVFLALAFFGWLFLFAGERFVLPWTIIVPTLTVLLALAVSWLYALSKDLRGVLSQLINDDPQALAQQYEKTLGLGESESIAP